MPVLIGIKSVIINAVFDFTDSRDPLIICGRRRANEYVFFTLFFIPLIPLRCRQSIWIDEYGNMYKRKVGSRGKIANQLFGIVGVFILFILIGVVANSFNGGHVHTVRF